MLLSAQSPGKVKPSTSGSISLLQVGIYMDWMDAAFLPDVVKE